MIRTQPNRFISFLAYLYLNYEQSYIKRLGKIEGLAYIALLSLEPAKYYNDFLKTSKKGEDVPFPHATYNTLSQMRQFAKMGIQNWKGMVFKWCVYGEWFGV